MAATLGGCDPKRRCLVGDTVNPEVPAGHRSSTVEELLQADAGRFVVGPNHVMLEAPPFVGCQRGEGAEAATSAGEAEGLELGRDPACVREGVLFVCGQCTEEPPDLQPEAAEKLRPPGLNVKQSQGSPEYCNDAGMRAYRQGEQEDPRENVPSRRAHFPRE